MKVSVIIPVYNAEKYLKRCLDSIKNQDNFDELEIIIINDGSTDNSKKIISSFQKGKKNIIVKNIKNSGVSQARNIGIDLATCKYISFVDSDDFIEPDYYVTLLKELKTDPKNELIISGFTIKYENSFKKIKRSVKQKQIITKPKIIEQFLYSNFIGPNACGKLFLTNIVKKIKFDKDLAVAEDKWFVFQYLLKINQLTILPITKYNYFINKNSVFMQSFNKNKLHSIVVGDKIKKIIEQNYPNLLDKMNSYNIDVKCRIYCQLHNSKLKNEYIVEYEKIKREIKKYSIYKKIKNSNLKHFLTFLLTRISPKLYNFFSQNLKLQYKI